MTITYPLSFPASIKLNGITPSLHFIVGSSQSPFTGAQQVIKWSGEYWRFDCSLPPMNRAQAEEWLAFYHKLRGRYGTFLLGDFTKNTPRGAGGGTPLVDGAGQSLGYELNINGCTPNISGWGLKGDMVQVGADGASARLHKLTEDIDTDGSGNATLEFVPKLRYSPADNTPIYLTGAKGVFRMESSTVDHSVDVNRHYRMGFTAMEAL